MNIHKHFAFSTFATKWPMEEMAAGLAICLAFLFLAVPSASAQTFQVIHSFTGGGDDASPGAGLTPAGPGKFYGTTNGTGTSSDGSVFKLTYSGSGWVLQQLTDFHQAGGGARPSDRVTIGPDGALYADTYLGGQGDCGGNGSCGVVFKLQPPTRACVSILCPWRQDVLYQFGMPPDAGIPVGDVVFDSAGNLYGVTEYGGSGSCGNLGCGAVYMLTRSGGGWTQTIIHNFLGGIDGQLPFGGLYIDAAGNLYGTTAQGGSAGFGTIYELSPSNGGWTKTILHNFQGSDSSFPTGSLVADQNGNLYGTGEGSIGGHGAVYELSQPGTWNFQILYTFPYQSSPTGSPTLDASGNIYGALYNSGNGSIFKLTQSNGNWIQTDLHDFQTSDGIYPNGGLVFDAAGNLYGTTEEGGSMTEICYLGCGTVWEITF